VDVQSTRQQTQYQRETLEALPGTGRLTGLSQVIPGATLANPQQYSVGGVNGLCPVHLFAARRAAV
jgi:hypothetical protein